LRTPRLEGSVQEPPGQQSSPVAHAGPPPHRQMQVSGSSVPEQQAPS